MNILQCLQNKIYKERYAESKYQQYLDSKAVGRDQYSNQPEQTHQCQQPFEYDFLNIVKPLCEWPHDSEIHETGDKQYED